MNCQTEHPLARVCYGEEGDIWDNYVYEALRNLRHSSIMYLSEAGWDAGYLGTCPYWVNIEERVPAQSLEWLHENWLGDKNCTYEEFFRRYGPLLNADYDTRPKQADFLRRIATNQLSE